MGIKEGFHVLRRNEIKPTPQKLWWFNLPAPILTVVFSAFLRTTMAETTMAKHCVVAKSEMIALQQEFDKLIIKSGIPTPIMNKLRENLFITK